MKKTFVFACTLGVAALLASSAAAASNVGKRYPSEKTAYVDAVTGVPITVLTTSPANDAKLYQTHPQWTSDGSHIVFRSNRASPVGSREAQAFAVNVVTGDIVQLTDHPGTGTGSLNVAHKSMRLFFFRRETETAQPRLVELDLKRLLDDAYAGTVAAPDTYERIIATLPDGLRESGGFSIDADESKAYVGVGWGERDQAQFQRAATASRVPQTQSGSGGPGVDREAARQRFEAAGRGPGGIRSIDLDTGEVKTVINVDLRMGHVQTNYWAPGEIMYCHETTGDAPQRMWFVRADGSDHRPLYVETPDEWVTHEVFVDADHIMFNVMGHLDYLRKKPTGVFLLNTRTDDVRVLGQGPDRGFWHCNGSPDRRWAVADDFDGNITLINRESGEMTVLSTNHKMRPDHAHPTFHPDSRQILIQSGLLTDGRSLDLMVINIPPHILERR
jgi:oligogalacturonide lyase